MDNNDLCDQVLACRSARDEIKAQLAAAEKELETAEAALAKALGAADESVEHGGFKFSATTTVSWRMKSEGKDELIALFKSGAPEVVKESINAATLNSYLRKHEAALDEESASWWESAKSSLDRSEKQSLSVRKATAKKASKKAPAKAAAAKKTPAKKK